MYEPTNGSVSATELSVQPGYRVFAADGQELGRVIEVDDATFTLKSGGLLGGKTTIPRRLIRESDEGRVELRVGKADLDR
jgi:hypothetical protein